MASSPRCQAKQGPLSGCIVVCMLRRPVLVVQGLLHTIEYGQYFSIQQCRSLKAGLPAAAAQHGVVLQPQSCLLWPLQPPLQLFLQVQHMISRCSMLNW